MAKRMGRIEGETVEGT